MEKEKIIKISLAITLSLIILLICFLIFNKKEDSKNQKINIIQKEENVSKEIDNNNKYSLKINSIGYGQGQILNEKNENIIDKIIFLEKNTKIKLTPKPENNSVFLGFEKDCEGFDCELYMDKNKEMNVIFSLKPDAKNIETIKEQIEENNKYRFIKVNINNINSGKGNIKYNIFKEPNGFPSNYNNSYMNGTITLENQETNKTFTLEKLEPGTYALSVIQDENDNNKIDTALFGIPTEKYGFSNNPKINFGPPNFDECKFDLQNNIELNINMN